MNVSTDKAHVFKAPASELMSAPVHTLLESDRLTRAQDEMAKLGISALAVVDRNGGMVGVISRSDLLRAGRVRLMSGHPKKVLSLPDATVRQYMAQTVEVVTSATALFEVARRMQRHHIHRVFVSEDRLPLGVVSTTEMMTAVEIARVMIPVAELMHKSVVSVNAGDPLSLAVDRMAAAHHSGVVVLEDRWPVGMFTQAEALAARDARPDDRVDHWMDSRLIAVPMHMPLFRAAEQLVATRARRLIAVDADGTRGILSGMDFARCVAEL